MSWQENLTEKLNILSQSEFTYIETNDIQKASELDLNCTGLYLEATVIYFEIKNLGFLLKEHGRRKVAQTYTIFREVLGTITEGDQDAFVNCFSPNAFLVVYPGKESGVKYAVKAAMKISSYLSEALKKQFHNINGLEFSMGVDHGHIMGTKCLSDNNMQTMTWFGTTIQKAGRICRECGRPYYVGISSSVYHNLDEELLVTTKRILGIKKRVELWSKQTYQLENVKHHLYQTNHKINLNEA